MFWRIPLQLSQSCGRTLAHSYRAMITEIPQISRDTALLTYKPFARPVGRPMKFIFQFLFWQLKGLKWLTDSPVWPLPNCMSGNMPALGLDEFSPSPFLNFSASSLSLFSFETLQVPRGNNTWSGFLEHSSPRHFTLWLDSFMWSSLTKPPVCIFN